MLTFNRNYPAILLVVCSVFVGLSGCADVAVNAYESMRPPTDDELTMRIFESGCTDLKWTQPNNVQSTEEYFKLIRIQRGDKNKGNGECQVQCTGGKRLSGEERTSKCKQEIEAQVVRQRKEEEKKYAEIAQQNAIAKAKADQMYSGLAAKGYAPMSIDDFQLDAESLPSGKKIYIDGYYEIFGDVQYLVRSPTAGHPQQYQIPLLSGDADRESRKVLIKMQQSCVAGRSACQMTVIGKVTRCKVTYPSVSKNKTCINIDTFVY